MKKMLLRLRDWISHIPTPVMLTAVCILSYGLLIPWLGYYLDDWYIVLYQKYFGAGDFTSFFNQDRPLFAYVYQVFVPIFRDSKIAWQIFALFSHSLAAICFWWLLTKLMPSRKTLSAVTALFFAVYPAFQFHWFAVMYSQVFMLLAIYFLSYILMIESIRARRGRAFYWIGALLCQAIGIIPQETFIGLEVVRPIVLWVVLTPLIPTNGKRLKRTLLYWAPYLVVLSLFVVYRLGNAQAFSYQASLFTELSQSPLPTVVRLIGEIFWSVVDAIFVAWTNLINLLKRDLLSMVSAVMLILVVFGIGFTHLFLKGRPGDEEQPHKNRWLLWIGLLATVSAMAPFIAGSFKITLDFPNNRYLIALAPGASLFLAGLIDSLLKTKNQKLITGSILIGFAIGAQFITARSYMLIWQAQQDFFWQLAWRAPALESNTLLVSDDLPFSKYYSGPSLTAPLNLIYAPESNSHNLPYLFLLVSQQGDVIPDLVPDEPIESYFRSFEFNGNTSAMLVFKKPADGCLRILTADDSTDEFLLSLRNSFWHSAIPLSNLDRIISNPENPAIPPGEFFGSENRNQWCYYFEKADLARQNQDWAKTIQWYQDAQAAGFHPLLDSEKLPLVEAYLKMNEVEKALEITKSIVNHEQTNTAGFCQVWETAKDEENVIPFAAEALSWMNCRE